ncbi:hypothetical protein C4K22_1896 [Pseudomonas chlororaphis subsp. aurantiaca]|nr:hypothetical protein C4K22_1896 [Pseudomonas chlororaphis subsp. aurantiaca]AZD40984.1 hypothetical protein C4K21_1900 [Pseudomonas chlororaphis subsp. aurantiaca]
MRINFLAGIGAGFILIFSAEALAEPCDKIFTALQQERYLSQVRQTTDKGTTEYRDGQSTSLSVSCALGKPNVAVSWDGSKPDQQFYDLVGRAGILISSRSAADIVKASKQCRQQVIKDRGEIATIELDGLAIECQAFDRDGGGTTITVFAE